MRRRRWCVAVLLACVLVGGCGRDSWSSGDRVLVSKFAYDSGLTRPDRWDVVVFKYPQQPVKNGAPKNYIKRLLGLPGELLAILFGRIYAAVPSDPSEYLPNENVSKNEHWKSSEMRDKRLDLSLAAGKAEWDHLKFQIQRKPLATLMAMRRIVNDNDFQPKDLQDKIPPRWAGAPPSDWAPDAENKIFRNDGKGKDVDWLRYRHLLRPEAPNDKLEPQLITDFEAYNNYSTQGAPPHPYRPGNWVGDLMLECKLKVEEPQGEFLMELSKGVGRFRAVWDLTSGQCTLYRIDKDGHAQVLGEAKPTALKAAGEYDLRFANVDARLTVWVNGQLPFGDGQTYEEPAEWGPRENDLQPASLGTNGAKVEVRHLKLWRDTYYTSGTFADPHGLGVNVDWTDPKTWASLRTPLARVMFVQPGHYLCMGDNSPQSSDSREWGVVPERLMLGRALLVYYPFTRAGRIE